jgi:hypothetical protein
MARAASPRTDFLHGREVPDLCMRLTDPRKLDAKVPLYVGESASVLRTQSEAWESSTTMTLMGVCVSSRRAVIFLAKRSLIGQKATIEPHTFVEEQTDDPNSASYFNGGGGFRGRLSLYQLWLHCRSSTNSGQFSMNGQCSASNYRTADSLSPR